MLRFFINFILLAVAFSLAFFWMRPEWRQISSLRSETKSYQETLSNLQTLQKLRDRFLRDYNSISENDRDKLAKMLPSSIDEGEIMVMIENLVKSNGLFLKTISFESRGRPSAGTVIGEQKKPYNSSLVAIEFAGSYESLKNFLKNLEENLLITDVETLSFQSAGDKKSEETLIYIFKITTRIHWQVEQL